MEFNRFLSGKIIYLREVRTSDVTDEYYNWMNDPEVVKFLETRYYPRSKENITNFVKSLDGCSNQILFAICDKTTERHIGNIKIGPVNWVHRFADISLLIGDKNFWGKGIATEAIQLVCNYGFNNLNLNKIKAGAYEQNIGSIKAFMKAGFTKEGLIKKQWNVGGVFFDEVLLGITFDEFHNI